MTKTNVILAGARAEKIKTKLSGNSDVVVRNIKLKGKGLALIFVDELVEQEEINLNIITPLTKCEKMRILNLDTICKSVVSFCQVDEVELKDCCGKILKGYTVLVLDGEDKALAFNTISYEGRSIEEPPSSTVISGPREGFTENVKTNVGLIRKRLVTEQLKIEDLSVGAKTKTAVKIMYLKDLTNKKIVDEIRAKIKSIQIDGVLDSYYLANLLEDHPNSIFRQIGNCEKPDIACAKLLEGRVCIIVDGSPIVLTLPFLLFEDFQSSNDYYSEAHRSSMLRILRIVAIIISVYLPGMYMALQLYHYKVLPLKFLVTIINTTQNLPLNPFLEIFFIIVLFDILFEASIRMPKYLGIAVSIVGALILGDTAVSAGLVSPPGVMIVAMSAITIYIIPNQSSQLSLLRFAFAYIGGILGFHGIIIGNIFMFAYITHLDSYYTPYLAPYAPYVIEDQNDSIFKDNVSGMTKLPRSLPIKNKTRQRVPYLTKNGNRVKDSFNAKKGGKL